MYTTFRRSYFSRLERACYVVATEKWAQQCPEPFFPSELPAQEDPELHFTLLQELAREPRKMRRKPLALMKVSLEFIGDYCMTYD